MAKIKIVSFFSTCIVILTLVGIYSYRSTIEYSASNKAVIKSQNTILELEKILELMQKVESQQRIYIITGEEKNYTNYQSFLKELRKEFQATKENFRGTKNEKLFTNTISKAVNSKIQFCNTIVAVRKKEGFTVAQKILLSGKGDDLMNKVRSSIKHYVYIVKKESFVQMKNKGVLYSKTLKSVTFSIGLINILILITIFTYLKYNKIYVQQEKKLKESNERFIKIFDNSSAAMVLTNLSTSKIEFINKGFLEISGFEKDEVIGHLSSELGIVDEESRSKIIEELQEKGSLDQKEINVHKKNGERIWVSYSMVIIEIDDIKYSLTTLLNIQERKDLDAEIQKMNDFQNLILSSTEFAIITTSHPDGIITTFNKGAEKMLGYSAEEVVNKTTPAIFHDEREVIAKAKKLSEELNVAIQPGIDVFHYKSRVFDIIDRNEWTYICKDGSRFTIELTIKTLKDSNGKIISYLGVAKDISAIKKENAIIIKAKEEAEQANQLKETFLANMSHEIRTPMNAIVGFTDLLLNSKLAAKEKDYVKTIKTSSENLLRIINDILDVSKIESGMMTFEEHPLSIKEVFSSLSNMLMKNAKDKNLNLEFTFDDKIPGTLLGDPTRLTQIIINCVGNAIKFTKIGFIAVHAKVLPTEDENSLIEFSIKDSGIGIDETKLNSVFERFRQAESHTTRDYGGTGLGLSIVKQLVELQGGTINIESKVGFGTHLSFTLPFKKADQNHVVKVNAHHKIDFEKLSDLKILLVEDNPINIKFITSLFSEHNLKATIAENGKLAIEQLKIEKFDIILMDIEMPEMNGYQTTTFIREEMKSNIPIIAMTAHAMAGEKDKCLKLGMNDYLSKPINSNLLFEKILIETAHLEEKVSKLMDLDYLITSFHGNKGLILEILDLFVEQIPIDLIELNSFIKESNYSQIKSKAHRMKSSVTVLGLLDLEKCLGEIELKSMENQSIVEIENLENKVIEICEQVFEEIKNEREKFL